MIAFIDSGVGGLSLVKALFDRASSFPFIYYADRKHFPYGTKTKKELSKILETAVETLLPYEPEAIFLACHTASLVDLPQRVIPITSCIEPLLNHARGHIALWASQRTIATGHYQAEFKKRGCTLYPFEKQDLIQSIEESNGFLCQKKLNQELSHLPNEVEALFLGSTHFSTLDFSKEPLSIEILDPVHFAAAHIHTHYRDLLLPSETPWQSIVSNGETALKLKIDQWIQETLFLKKL